MLKENNSLRDFHNITLWHELGIDGSLGGAAATCETPRLEFLTAEEQAKYTYLGNTWNDTDGTEHGIKTAKVFWEVAPGAHLYTIPGALNDTRFLAEGAKYIKDYNITVMFESMSTKREFIDSNDEILEELSDFFTHNMSVGNYGSERYNYQTKDEYSYAIGACRLSSGKPVIESYTSEFEDVDYCALSRWAVDYNSNGYLDGNPSGTSFSGPTVAGMQKLVNHWFFVKTGSVLSSKNMDRFMKDHCVDIDSSRYGVDDTGKDGNPDYDIKSGHGIVILPDPREIDLWKYQTKNKPEGDVNVDNRKMVETFNDADKVKDYQIKAVQLMLDLGLLSGYADNTIGAEKPITRGDFAVILQRAGIADLIKLIDEEK